jgi:hypothetical protein
MAGVLACDCTHLPHFQIELNTNEVLQQRVDYIHNNPVEMGFVAEPQHWMYSSAIDYSGGKGMIELYFLD